MKSLNNEAIQPATFEQVFDCRKMKSLIDDKETPSFADRFKNWVAAYTRDAHEKIWKDVEYFQAH